MTDEKRNKKLDLLQTKHRQLVAERIPLAEDAKAKQKIANKATKLVQEKTREIHEVGQQIFDMKHGGATPHVTDHAVVRYLERVKGVDIWKLKEEVSLHKDAVREGNVIVTINEDLSDLLEKST